MQNKITARILFVAHSIGCGGAERSLNEILRALLCVGRFELGVVYPEEDGVAGAGCLEEFSQSVKLYHMSYPWWISWNANNRVERRKHDRYILKLIYRSIQPAISILKDFRPDIVVTNTSIIPTFAIASKIKRIPHCWCVRESVTNTLGLRFLFRDTLSYFLIGKLSDIVFVNSWYIYSELSTCVPLKKLKVVYQAVDKTTSTIGSGFNKLVCLVAGNVRPLKGQEEVIEAFRLLDPDRFVLKIAGNCSSSYANSLKNRAPQNVQFLGEVQDMDSLYKEIDVLIIGSMEAYGRTAIEAMIRHIPVIYTKKGAGPELIKDGWNGYLYEPGCISDLVQCVLKLESKEERERIGNNGYEFVERNCNKEKMIEDIVNPMYEIIVKRNKSTV